jgi:hypothetical protein
MKKLTAILILVLTAGMLSSAFAQGSGEIGFKRNSLSEVNKIEIFPNPSVDFLNIEINNSKMKKPVLELYSIIGNVVKVELENITDNRFRVDVSKIPAGYYLLSIRDEQTQFKETYKFLKR